MISRVAATPPLTGMCRSIKITSGCSTRANSTASSAIASLAHDLHVRLQRKQVRRAPAHLCLIFGDHDPNCRLMIPFALGHGGTLVRQSPSPSFLNLSSSMMRLVYHRLEVTLVTT